MVTTDIATNRRIMPFDGSAQRARRWGIVAGLMVVVFILWHVRTLMDVEDSVVYFAYFNNSPAIHVPFYYGGYVALYSQLAAYMASFVSFAWQPVVYIAATSIIGAYFIRQLLIFTDDVLKAPVVAAIFAFCLVAVMVRTHGTFNLFVNLTYNIWIGWLGLYLRVLNGLRGHRAGLSTILIGILCAWSHSFSVVLILPLLGALVLPLADGAGGARRYDYRLRGEFAIYLVAAVLFPILMIEPGFPKPLLIPDMSARLVHMLLDIRSNAALTVVIGALLFLFALSPAFRSARLLVRGAPIARDDYLRLVVAFVGFGTVAIIFASGRLFIADKVWARYLFTPLLSLVVVGLVVAARSAVFRAGIAALESRLQKILSRPTGRVASTLVGLVMLAATSILPWHTFKENIVRTVDTERFLAAAEAYRATCQDGAFIQSWDKWSLAVLCHRRNLPKDPEAVSLTEDHVTVWNGGQSRTADHPKSEVPMLFQPLDVMTLPGR